MKSKILYLLFYYLIVLNSVAFAQSAKIDSLRILLEKDKDDTLKLIHLYSLSDEFETIGDFNNGIKYGKEALSLSEILLENNSISYNLVSKKRVKKYRAKVFNNLGLLFYNHGDYFEAIKNHKESLKIKEELDDKSGVARSYNNIGVVYYYQGIYPEALKFYFACLKINEELGDKSAIAIAYNNIGNIYADNKNYEEALKNYFACLKIAKEIDDKNVIANSYNNIGSIFYFQGKYKDALENQLSSLKINEAIGNPKGLSDAYNNIGNIYCDQQRYSDALNNHFRSLKISDSIADKAGVASSYTSIGNVLAKQNKFNEAEIYFIKSENISLEIGYKKYLKHIYNALAELDSARGDYKGAYENHKQYILYRDSLDNEETRKKMIQSQMTFEFEKKEAVANAEHVIELENQQVFADEKSRKQKIVILFVVCGLLLVLVFAGFIFKSLRVTRKQKDTIELQKQIVESQKRQVEQQKIIVEEHQKEIIDSITYARRIQHSLLPTEKYIEKNFKRLMKR